MSTQQSQFRTYVLLFVISALFLVVRIVQFDLSIDTDDWGILLDSRQMLDSGVLAGDPNKSLELLVAIIPNMFQSPILFAYITALFGALLCLGAYRLFYTLTQSPAASLLGWGALLICPVLYWQVVSCNSVVYQTCFLIWSLVFFVQRKSLWGCVFLTLAGFSRLEPFILIVPVFYFLYREWRCGQLPSKNFLRETIILMMAPLWWLAFNYLQFGHLLGALQRVHTDVKDVISELNPFNFPTLLWNNISDFYMSPLALAIGVIGFFVFLPRLKKHYFLYSFMIVTIIGLWGFSLMNYAVIERFLLPIFIYLLAFSVLIFNRLERKLPQLSEKGPGALTITALAGVMFLFANVNFKAQALVEDIIVYHNNFDRDIPVLAERLRKSLEQDEQLKVLITNRRFSMLRYHLYDMRDRVTLVSFRNLFFNRTDLEREKIDIVVFAPNDLFPVKSAFYNFGLLSPEGLNRQGLRIVQKWKLSEHTQMLRVARQS